MDTFDKENLQFPKGFLWGAATASHQVEGNNKNDWTEWEKGLASRLASEARSKFGHLRNWKKIEKDATNPENYISGIACDHYNRYKEDFKLAKELGHNATRFSIEWSRIEPEEGKFDEEAIAHYRDVIKTCRENGLEPFVTLWHWTMPLWLARKGGFSNKKFPKYFEKYVGKITERIGSEIKFWVTLNEPDVVASHSYLKGVWPPQKRNFITYYKSLSNLKNAHKLAYIKIKDNYPDSRVGIAKHQVSFVILRQNITNFLLKKCGHYFWNRWFLNRIKNHQDFIGLNHYNRNVVDGGFGKNPNKQLTDFGWEFYPESIYQSLLELKSYNKPIYITENGIADANDNMRGRFIERALSSVGNSIKSGADVRGYMYWSLLDNFEWDKGFWPRFGLIEIDYDTLERRPRPSAFVYKKIIENNSL